MFGQGNAFDDWVPSYAWGGRGVSVARVAPTPSSAPGPARVWSSFTAWRTCPSAGRIGLTRQRRCSKSL